MSSRISHAVSRFSPGASTAIILAVETGNAANLPEIVRRIVEAYQPLRIYLFGSEARGDGDADSDLDLAVIVDDDADPANADPRRAAEALWGLERGADVVVFRSRDFDERRTVVASLPWTIAEEGRVVHGG